MSLSLALLSQPMAIGKLGRVGQGMLWFSGSMFGVGLCSAFSFLFCFSSGQVYPGLSQEPGEVDLSL